MTCAGMSYNSILFIVGLHDQPVQIPIDAPGLAGVFIPPDSIVSDQNSVSTSKSWSPDTTFKLDCGYHLRVIYENINEESHDCMEKEPSALACDIANPFPPDLWGCVHGFSY